LNNIQGKKSSQVELKLESIDPYEIYGEKNSKLQLVKNNYPDLQIVGRGTSIKIAGEKSQVQEVKSIFELFIAVLKSGEQLTKQVVEDILNGNNPMDSRLPASGKGNLIVYGRNGYPIKAKTKNQKHLVDLSKKNDIVFAIGPAGTGKTYTAVALAVAALKNKTVKKIILTRPAVEAGESLGFLPGDLKDKIDPYLRPLYDALDDMLPAEKLKYFTEIRTIEVAPLAFMRGRTLDNAFIILDEAQNCTSAQIKMFLTRLGPSAKCIITGDMSQIDLPYRQTSGLYKALKILKNVSGIGQIYLDASDVVRHRLVKEIIKEYNRSNEDDSHYRDLYKKEQSGTPKRKENIDEDNL
jgi:phosphate starvation-inducible PhoH-like protein